MINQKTYLDTVFGVIQLVKVLEVIRDYELPARIQGTTQKDRRKIQGASQLVFLNNPDFMFFKGNYVSVDDFIYFGNRY